MELKNIFECTAIGSLTLSNRIVMPPMCTCLASSSGEVTQRQIDYYVERAKGGVGLIIVEATNIDFPQGNDQYNKPAIDHDKYIAGLSDLVEAVHLYGVKIAIQLHHAGRQTSPEYTEGKQPVSASDVPCKMSGSQPRPLTIEEIERLVEIFSEGARRAKESGFDAVEVHGAHGYLISSFLSHYTNKRTDRYGGDLEHRMRFPLEIIERIKKKVGYDFPIIFRMNGDDYVDGGLRLPETRTIAQELERAGVQAIHVSAGMHESFVFSVQPGSIPLGVNVHLAQGIKESVTIPVIAVGRINDPEQANEIIQQKKADLVSMGRALIADPKLPRKGAEGRHRDIRKCVACLECLNRIMNHKRIRCMVNAAVGNERDFTIIPAPKPKKVLVVGAGPAGMEAARVLALRKHTVTLCEKSTRLGGQLNLSVTPSFKNDLKHVYDHLTTQIEKLRVNVALQKEVTPEFVRDFNADAVIIAAGGKPLIPKIEGIEKENVIIGWDVLDGKVRIGKSAIIAGGGEVGCEIADFLLEKGTDVTIVEMLKDLAIDADPFHRQLLLERLSKRSAKMFTETFIDKILDGGTEVHHVRDPGKKWTLVADKVVLALGAAPNHELYEAISGAVSVLYAVGDCVEPRNMLDAIHEASFIARQI